MRKKVFGRKFSRDYGSRQALFRALIRSLILTGGFVTTKPKAKAIQPDIDALVNLAKDKAVAKQRQAFAMLGNDRESLMVLTDRVAPAFSAKTSGYTRIIPLPNRGSDNAEKARIEWTEKVEIVAVKKQDEKKKAKKEEAPKEEKKGLAKLIGKAKKEKKENTK